MLSEDEDKGIFEKYNFVIRGAKHNIEEAEDKIKKANWSIKNSQTEKHRLLNHENDLTRETSTQMYDKYCACSEKDKRLGKKWDDLPPF